MPYVADVYQLPPGTAGTPNTSIESAKYNTFIADITTAQNTARPVLGGGTGGQTAVAGNDGLNTKGADIASGTTTDLSTATGVYVNVTGTTTIASFGTAAAGVLRQMTFTGILTLTYNATSLILPGAANLTTAVGDTATFRSLGGGNWRCVDYLRASGQSPTNIITSPNIVGATTISGTATGDLLTLTSTDATSGAGPDINCYRNSASPAANDFLGQINFTGKNSIGGTIQYSGIAGQILDPTSGSEDSALYSATYVAGAIGVRWYTGAGLYMTGATGGDKGAGTVNATGYYTNGAALPFTKAFESAQQTITSAGPLTLAHGLGVQPKFYMAYLVCTTAEGGYSIGDETPVSNNDNGTAYRGVSIVPDATNINTRYSLATNVFNLINKTSGNTFLATNANWKMVVRAWA